MTLTYRATKKVHKCPEHHSDQCRKEWYEDSVEDEPIYKVCNECTEYDARELSDYIGGGD